MTRPILLLLLFLCHQSAAQICDGNIGENIFTEGDFGSGSANVILTNPQIAPGYTYQSNPPPNDGFYTITNSMFQWSSVFLNWMRITDNSSDPNGYMMVVNASHSPGIFYKQEVDDLCENTLYVFSADVHNIIQSGSGYIKPNISFLIDGVVQYQTGDIPENEKWNTYGFTFSTGPGQTTVTLSLQNNAPGGIGNDLALDNITFRPCGPEALILPTDIANICEDGSPIELEATVLGTQYTNPSFQWQRSLDGGLTWENIPGETGLTYLHTDLSAGYYYYRYLLANDPANLLNSRCRVVSNVKVVHVVPKFYTIVDTLCEGLSFSLGNNFYAETGIYVDSLLTSIGCDSIVTLDLTIIPDAGIEAVFNLNNPSCADVLDGSIQVETIINGVAPYDVFINGEPVPAPGNLSNLGVEPYTFSIVDQYGCSFDTILALTDPPPFTIELGDDQHVLLGESVFIDPFFSEPAIGFNWQPADLVECAPNCLSLSFVPTTSALYSLTATSANGCVATDSIYISVETIRNVYIPNAFSPNDDGINDFFTVFAATPNVQLVERLVVFDRWGGIVFDRAGFAPNETSLGWDGTARGQRANLGVYTYFAEIRFLDGAVILFEGDVVLIR